MVTGGSTFRHSVSGTSLNVPKTAGGSIRITDQVIEEVDEQATITSMRRPDPHPSVRTIFANPLPLPDNPVAMEEGVREIPPKAGGDFRPPPSAPVNVPYSAHQAEARSAGDIQPRFSDNFPEVRHETPRDTPKTTFRVVGYPKKNSLVFKFLFHFIFFFQRYFLFIHARILELYVC